MFQNLIAIAVVFGILRGQNKPLLKSKGVHKDSCLVTMCSRRPLFTWRPRSSDSILREVRLFKMAVLAGICLLVVAICPAVRAQGRAGSFVTALELIY